MLLAEAEAEEDTVVDVTNSEVEVSAVSATSAEEVTAAATVEAARRAE